MKIAIVALGLTNGGGVPSLARWLGTGLRDICGHEVELINLSSAKRDDLSISILDPLRWGAKLRIEKDVLWGFSMYRVGSRFSEIELARYSSRKELRRLINQFDAVVVVAGTPAVANILRGVKIPRFLQVATRARLERRALFMTLKGVRLWYAKLIQPFVDVMDESGLKVCDGVFVENFHMLDFSLKHVGSLRTYFAPPGIVTAQYIAKSDWKSSDYILCVGRLADPRKNFGMLLQAYKLLIERYSLAPKLVLAGLGDLSEANVRYIKSYGLSEMVDVRRNVPLGDLPNLYRNAGVFALSSDEEGFGLVILEAMASGLPVVATDCGGPSAMINHGENGYLVDIGDSDQMASALFDVLTNRDLAIKFGAESRRRATQEFESSVCVKRFSDVIEFAYENR